MAKRKPLTKTQRERRLVQQQVRRMESRGYRIDESTKQKIKSGNYQTLHALRKNKYAKLYNAASSEIDGKIVGGLEKRKYDRSQVALKAAKTVRKKQEEARQEQEERQRVETRQEQEESQREEVRQEQEEGQREEARQEQAEWEETRAKQDEADLTLANAIDEGQVMYRNILDLMEKFPREGRNLLYQGLDSEIRQYGLDMVMAGMAYAPIDVVQEAQNIIFYTGDKESTHRALVNFFDAISGTIRTIQDSMGIGAVMDQMTDMSSP